MDIKKSDGATVITIEGDPKKPEKAETIIKFPTGEVSIMRTSDNNYWVHVSVRKDYETEKPISRIQSARLDIEGVPVHLANVGDLCHDGLYHIAFLTTKKGA